MYDHEKLALVLRPPGAFEKVETSAKRVLSGMVSDALTLARVKQSVSGAKKFVVGDIELREPDYLQLMSWADQLKLAPLEVLRRLKAGLRSRGDETVIENGSFIKLHWDPGLLTLSEFQISQELRLVQLSFTAIESVSNLGVKEAGVGITDDLPPGYDLETRILNISTAVLPKLKRLDCCMVGLENLAAGQAVSLESLDCSGNYLEQLDLSSFPSLKTLNCLDNRCTNLNLAHVPQLLVLDCQLNLIRELDLCPVSKLRKLNCSDNNMQKLILPHLPNLIELDCENSAWDKESGAGCHLEKLDLKGAPNLTRLNCLDNALEHLDLSCASQLRDLNCAWNLLTELDLSCVPKLETLRCSSYHLDSVWIKTLDIRPLLHLKELSRDPRTCLIQRPDQHFKS